MSRLFFNYPDNLPLSQQKQRICEAIAHHQVVIISGETGSGKTTQLPKICLELGRGVTGMIGHTQPRRLAAHRVAQRIAEELKTPLGECVGYQMRFHQKMNENTSIKLMTDGILLSEIQHDRLLVRYDTLIIDEAHERSLNIDFILGYLRQLLPKRPDLKIIITSATLDSQKFSDHFNQAPVIAVSGQSYPVREFLNHMRVYEWQDVHAQLKKSAQKLHLLQKRAQSCERKASREAVHYYHLHAALLTGLLSHIGQKDMESHEFTGPRHTRFTIFPHSGLFKKPPQWIMVSQLLETRRLWGHIAARIKPEWLEPLATHLLKRHYSEPHWEKAKGAVMAHEKVTLFGLPIIYDRKINYGSIDPKLCRTLLIQQGLVEGHWETNHAFFHNNLKLLLNVEELENKSRRRDILVDDHTLFEFYDQRIGPEVVSSRHFDDWWKKTRQTQPDLLNFEKSMLIKANAQDVSEQHFPDFWCQGGFRLRLSYQFEPGSEADGVTVHIPLVILNQVQAQDFDWQVPGMRVELITALIKSLPKTLRRNFVPAPNYAQAILESISPFSGSFFNAIEQKLWQMSGVKIAREDWRWDHVPAHLKMTFRILDDHNQSIEAGKDLEYLRQTLTKQGKKTRDALIETLTFEKQNLKEWNFGTVPHHYESHKEGYSIQNYPALVDEKDSVALRLFETQQQQKMMMWKGIRRLLLLNIPSCAEFLRQKLWDKSKLRLYFNPYHNISALAEDCIACAIEKLMDEQGGFVWTQNEFLLLKEKIRQKVCVVSEKIAQEVQPILEKAFVVHQKLQGRCAPEQVDAFSDMQKQFSELMCPGFVSDNSLKPLSDILRYLKAIERRLEKLPSQLQTDRGNMEKIQKLSSLWRNWFDQLPVFRQEEKEIKQIRWMLEELRVSLFAQQLGTAYPVSEKRILNRINKLLHQTGETLRLK